MTAEAALRPIPVVQRASATSRKQTVRSSRGKGGSNGVDSGLSASGSYDIKGGRSSVGSIGPSMAALLPKALSP